MSHAIITVSTKMIAKLKETGDEVAKLLSFFLHCILITPNQRPIAIEVVFFFSNNERFHWSFQGHMIPIITCQRISTSLRVAMPGKDNLVKRSNTCASRHHYPRA